MWKKIRWFIPPLIVLIFILVFFIGKVGREKPPTQEVSNAEKVIAEAKEKEAKVYAQDILSRAEDGLKKAGDLIREKKYKEAKMAAEQASALAREAIDQVEPEKSKMRAEIEQTIPELRGKIEELKGLLRKSPKKMTTREGKELEGLIQTWEKDLSHIDGMIKEQKIRQAYDSLMALKKEIDSKQERFIPSPEEKKGIK